MIYFIIEITTMRILFIGTYLLIIFLYGCENQKPTSVDDELYPLASFTVSPSRGGSSTVFNFDASASFSRSETALSFRWDWDGDGTWDTDFSDEKYATHSYESLGYKTVILEVQDEKGISQSTKKEIYITVASKEMILIPAGEFWMGSPEGVGNADEHPQHKVYLDDFYIGKYEVTNEQYAEFLNAIGKNEDSNGNALYNKLITAVRLENGIYKANKGWEDRPVVGVSWYGSKAYAEWSGGRLLTEGEWEKSARGNDNRKWPWGDLFGIGYCNSWEGGIHDSTSAGSYPKGASPYGVQDMAGNVFEWINDWYQADYYKISPYKNPKGPDSSGFRIMKSGSWVEFANGVRISFRLGQFPSNTDTDSGFRIAKDM
jgi:formylglycine-generating enzyme required for sulfatase activity